MTTTTEKTNDKFWVGRVPRNILSNHKAWAIPESSHPTYSNAEKCAWEMTEEDCKELPEGTHLNHVYMVFPNELN